MFKSASMVFLSQASATVVLFLRNILVARLISVEDFGVASTFAIMFAMIEASTNVGLDRMIVQDRDGDTPQFQKVLQMVQLVRGVLGALVMLLVAYPYAGFMGTPEIVWTYQLMALIPLVRGALHLDMYRYQRGMRFMPFAVVMGASPVASVLVALGVYLVSPDYQTMLWAIIAHQSVLVAMTHLCAERPYRLAWDGAVFNRAMAFGIPMLLNGAAIFVILNGDRMIVGNQLGLEVLGWFSAAYMLAFTPTMVLGNTLNSMMLPQLTRRRDTPEAFSAMALTASELGLFTGALVAVGTAIAGPVMLLAFFGMKYQAALEVIMLLGVMQGVRMSKTGAATVAVALGRTRLPLYANLSRLIALPVGFYALEAGQGLTTLVLIATAGEAVGLVLLMGLMARALSLSVTRLVVPMLGFAVIIVAVLVDVLMTPVAVEGTSVGHFDSLHWSQLGLVLLILVAPITLPQTRAWLARRRRRGAA